MAITKSITTTQGFVAPVAYAHITSFNGVKDSIQVNVTAYRDLEARTNELEPIAFYTISLALANGASMQQMYDALKLDSNFLGAMDC